MNAAAGRLNITDRWTLFPPCVSCSRCPPRTFLPALCKIFLDESAPDNVLEVTARAITYYLDVSAECTRRIVGVDGAIKALCNRLVVVELNNRTSRDLAEQCVKVGGCQEIACVISVLMMKENVVWWNSPQSLSLSLLFGVVS